MAASNYPIGASADKDAPFNRPASTKEQCRECGEWSDEVLPSGICVFCKNEEDLVSGKKGVA